ncbi:MAG: glutathione peroxidase [Gammaproteobacteria bacterium]|nr:glutathione peroxidase [Gammaproteobacteria bacterium]
MTMRRVLLSMLLWGRPGLVAAEACSPLLDVKVRTLNEDHEVRLCEAYRDKVVLVVNTASKCAFTDQYGELETLYSRYRDRGLVVLGFPSNDFANQEPGTEKQIKSFCRLTYGVQFPMFAKTRVKKDHADPLYRNLGEAAGRYPWWNFHKYLIGRDGRLVDDYLSPISPLGSGMIADIERELNR